MAPRDGARLFWCYGKRCVAHFSVWRCWRLDGRPQGRAILPVRLMSRLSPIGASLALPHHAAVDVRSHGHVGLRKADDSPTRLGVMSRLGRRVALNEKKKGQTTTVLKAGGKTLDQRE